MVEIETIDEIQLATADFIFYCGIKSEQHFYVFRYSQRVPESVKQHGHIIDDHFILTNGHPNKSYNYTSELVDKLERLNKQKLKKAIDKMAKDYVYDFIFSFYNFVYYKYY